jgi:hypothetical protein
MDFDFESVKRKNPYDVEGVWSRVGKGDVHVYIQNDTVVIGQNFDYNDDINFSDLALVASRKDGVCLQYANGHEPAWAKVSEEVWRDAILGMLKGLRARVVEPAKEAEVK